MLDSNPTSVHVCWTEERLLSEIADLEDKLSTQTRNPDPDTRWRRSFLKHSLENRRRMLAALR